jgi:hypothetical protein
MSMMIWLSLRMTWALRSLRRRALRALSVVAPALLFCAMWAACWSCMQLGWGEPHSFARRLLACACFILGALIADAQAAERKR